MDKPATTMCALAFNKYCKPDEYELLQLPVPEIKSPDEILIKVHAAAINLVDLKVASGAAKIVVDTIFPCIPGRDLSGTIIAVGSDVPSHLKPGTEAYSLRPERFNGAVAEYALSSVGATAVKPRTLSHIQAASMPVVSLTALQAFNIAESHLDGGLKGKTVYIPAGLSGIGSIAIQLAKKVFGAAKVITTLSPSKIGKVESLLGKGVVDQIVDYTKEDPGKVLARGSVDFMFDIMGAQGLGSLHLMKKGGVIVSVTSSAPFGPDLKRAAPGLPAPIRWTLNGIGAISQCRARRYGVEYHSLLVRESAVDLNRLSKWIDEGLINPLVGRVAKMDSLEEVREGCLEVIGGKGSTGKFVIEIDDNSS